MSTSPTRAYGGASSQVQENEGRSPPPCSSKRCTNDASDTEPSHQAMLRTPTAPTQPTTPTSVGERSRAPVAQKSASTISVSWWTSTSASRSGERGRPVEQRVVVLEQRAARRRRVARRSRARRRAGCRAPRSARRRPGRVIAQPNAIMTAASRPARQRRRCGAAARPLGALEPRAQLRDLGGELDLALAARRPVPTRSGACVRVGARRGRRHGLERGVASSAASARTSSPRPRAARRCRAAAEVVDRAAALRARAVVVDDDVPAGRRARVERAERHARSPRRCRRPCG